MNKFLPLTALCLLGLAFGDEAKTVPALLKLQAWRQLSIQGVDYVSLSEVLRFYQFQLQAVEEGEMKYSNMDIDLSVKVKSQDIMIDGIKIKLLYPIRADGQGELLLAKHDCIYLLDPILRPQYITPRQQVKRIVIDPCHSDAMEGIRPKERKEKADLALQYALDLEEKLKAIGYDVVLTRRADYYVSPTLRMDMANADKDSLFISLRFNDYNAEYVGVESSIAQADEKRPSDSKNAALGMSLHSHLVRWAGLKDRGLQRVNYNVINNIDVPAICIALGNLGNVSERLNMHDNAQREAIIKALVQGIQIYAISVSEATEASVALSEGSDKLAPSFHTIPHNKEMNEIDAVEIDEEGEEIIAVDPDAD